MSCWKVQRRIHTPVTCFKSQESYRGFRLTKRNAKVLNQRSRSSSTLNSFILLTPLIKTTNSATSHGVVLRTAIKVPWLAMVKWLYLTLPCNKTPTVANSCRKGSSESPLSYWGSSCRGEVIRCSFIAINPWCNRAPLHYYKSSLTWALQFHARKARTSSIHGYLWKSTKGWSYYTRTGPPTSRRCKLLQNEKYFLIQSLQNRSSILQNQAIIRTLPLTATKWRTRSPLHNGVHKSTCCYDWLTTNANIESTGPYFSEWKYTFASLRWISRHVSRNRVITSVSIRSVSRIQSEPRNRLKYFLNP